MNQLERSAWRPTLSLDGTRPPAPEWFTRAVGEEPEVRSVDVGGVPVEMLVWGQVGRPGLLLVPGLFAHAHWWSFIAPLLVPEFRVAALSLSGMGRSGWREEYGLGVHAEELHACAQAAGLCEAGPPVYIGHSYGGWVVLRAAVEQPERLRAGILVDVGFTGAPAVPVGGAAAVSQSPRPEKAFADEDDAVRHFRLEPLQDCENPYIADFIARRSLRQLDDGRVAWSFDPDLRRKAKFGGMRPGPLRAPLLHVMGDRSANWIGNGGDQLPIFRSFMKVVRIPEAAHHVMLDQPLALVAALKAALVHWPAP